MLSIVHLKGVDLAKVMSISFLDSNINISFILLIFSSRSIFIFVSFARSVLKLLTKFYKILLPPAVYIQLCITLSDRGLLCGLLGGVFDNTNCLQMLMISQQYTQQLSDLLFIFKIARLKCWQH